MGGMARRAEDVQEETNKQNWNKLHSVGAGEERAGTGRDTVHTKLHLPYAHDFIFILHIALVLRYYIW